MGIFSYSFQHLFSPSSIFSFLFFLSVSSSLNIEKIPAQGSPPMNLLYSSSIYDASSSSIYVIGGLSKDSNSDTSSIYSYNLLTNSWSSIIPESEFIPEGIERQYSYLTSNRVIYNFFGISNSRYFTDVLTFDLKTKMWNKALLTGDHISGRMEYSATSFVWNGQEIIALYGGFTQTNYDCNLYL